MSINIALDGPSGAGKSTIAKAVAKKLEYIYVDTGALYRSIALYMIEHSVDLNNIDNVKSVLNGVDLKLAYTDGSQRVLLCGEDVSDKIRTPEISMGASRVSAVPAVREFLFDLQQNIAKESNIIMDGRDIGTVVLPKADVKIFLTASAEERAKRRFKELQEKGDSSSYEEVLADIKQRDYNDMHRDIAPLKKANDAVEVDTTSLNLDESVEVIYNTIIEELKKKPDNSDKLKDDASGGRDNEGNGFLKGLDVRPVDRSHKLSPLRMFIYNLLRYIVLFVYHIFYNLKFIGKENIPKGGSHIFASNHRSYADPVLISLAVRTPFSFMAKEELFKKNIFFAALIKALGAFPVTRGKGDTSAIDKSLKCLNKGRNLVIFPEGTRSKDGKVGRGKTGVALIAAVALVPVIPVGIVFEGKLKFRKKVTVKFGKPIYPDELNISSTSPKELKNLKHTIMNEIVDLVEADNPYINNSENE